MFAATTNLDSFQDEHSFAAQSIDFERSDGQKVGPGYGRAVAILRTPRRFDMAEGGAFYVYALKDPRRSPAVSFYIGKGVGTRAWDHLLTADETAKGKRITEIVNSGNEVLVTVICEDLSELQALRIEAELIASQGTEATGGLLTNSVLPTGKKSKIPASIIVPLGAPEKAQLGLSLLKGAVLELAQANLKGVTNSDVCHALGLHSNYSGGSKDYLSWSLLGLLMKEGRVKRVNNGGRGYHQAQVR
jgi:uncharacterized protein